MLNAFRVLDVLVADPRGLGLTATAQRAALNKATTYRLLSSLVTAGVVVQDGPHGRYRPGLKLVRLADRVLEALDFRALAQPAVDALAQQLPEYSVQAGVLEGAEVVYVALADGTGGLRVTTRLGQRRAIHVSSIGKVILAHLPPAEVEAILAAYRFERHTEHTIVDRGVFLAQLAQARAQGWALMCDEDALGATSASVAVFDRAGRPVGAIGVAGPSFLLVDGELERCVDRLAAICRAVSTDLGQPTEA